MSAGFPAVDGFQFAGVRAEIKTQGRDFGLIAFDDDFPTAAVFTRNRVRAAPVVLSEERLAKGRARAVLVNSGNANACTGRAGMTAAKQLTKAVAKELGIPAEHVLMASTGVIGVQLPLARMLDHVPALVAARAPESAAHFLEAILTTDRFPKTSVATVKLGSKRQGTILGFAKGAGMIHPNMATTLAFVVTDVAVKKGFLRDALQSAVDESFHRITVDGDTSTNDAVFLSASGRLGNEPLRAKDAASSRFVRGLTQVLEDLAKQIVKDGEGAEHLVRIDVRGATDDAAATQLARTVATSLLVKTALHGADPNYGRILGAMGRAGVAFDPNQVEIKIGDVMLFRNGTPVGPESDAPTAAVMKQPEYTIAVRVGRGKGRGHYFACDLGHEYVRINADYRT